MIKREQVLEFLRARQEMEGGFTGTDLTDLAEIHMSSVKRKIDSRIWKKLGYGFGLEK
jgi:hypothetical protein